MVKTEFVYKVEGIGTFQLKNCEGWEDVPRAFHDQGYVNLGSVLVTKRTWILQETEHKIIDTDY